MPAGSRRLNDRSHIQGWTTHAHLANAGDNAFRIRTDRSQYRDGLSVLGNGYRHSIIDEFREMRFCIEHAHVFH
jgi:hypothetical protein